MHLLFQISDLIHWGGIILIILLVFAETGLLLGLVLPGGETLIFSAGLFVSTGVLSTNIILLLVLLVVAGFTGDVLGYSLGNRMGPGFFRKKDTWYFKKRYLDAARNYFVRHKRRSILFGKFLPVIRPFTPLLSGISRIPKPVFLLLSFLSVLLYISFFLLLGYFLGNKFPSLQDYLGWILPISILALLIPTIIQIRKNRSSSASA